jgi:hypothetical protein
VLLPKLQLCTCDTRLAAVRVIRFLGAAWERHDWIIFIFHSPQSCQLRIYYLLQSECAVRAVFLLLAGLCSMLIVVILRIILSMA